VSTGAVSIFEFVGDVTRIDTPFVVADMRGDDSTTRAHLSGKEKLVLTSSDGDSEGKLLELKPCDKVESELRSIATKVRSLETLLFELG
jgi:hypothetical protein